MMSHYPGWSERKFLSVLSAVKVFSLQIPGHYIPGSVEFHPINAHLNTGQQSEGDSEEFSETLSA